MSMLKITQQSFGLLSIFPARLSARERLDEVASILALGLVRLRARQSSGIAAASENSSLDFNPYHSGGAVELYTTENAWK
jgi:hypothetical protein